MQRAASRFVALSLVFLASALYCVDANKIPKSVHVNLHSEAATVNAKAGSSSLRSATTPLPHDVVRREECLDVPQPLRVLGLGGICAELDLIGCQNKAQARIRMQGATSSIAEIDINPQQHVMCANRTTMGDSPLRTVCGPQMDVCISFINAQGQNTFHIEESALSACPTVIIKSCTPPLPNAPTLSDLPLAMGCMQIGETCAQHKTCHECTESVPGKPSACGWCSAGNKCLSGNQFGPRCGQCGSSAECECEWNFGSCPAKPEDLKALADSIIANQKQVSNLTNTYKEIREHIKHGDDVIFGNEKYKCETPGEERSSSAVSITVTVFVTLAVLIVTIILGAFVGKQGWADMAWERLSQIRLPLRRDDETALRPPSPSTYNPPAM